MPLSTPQTLECFSVPALSWRGLGGGQGMLSHVVVELGPVGGTKEQNQGTGRATRRLLCP